MTQQATDFREGDLVEATKGEYRIQGRVDSCDGSLVLPAWPEQSLSHSVMLDWLQKTTGWTLTLIDRPAPKVELPTEPGVYTYGKHGETVVLHEGGSWFCHGDGSLSWQMTDKDVADFAPFTRLEPAPVTAKRVIAAVRKAYHTDDPTYWGNLDRIAREFGVTE